MSAAERLSVYLTEYEQLKEEQRNRIGFRDNLLYVALGVYGGLFAFALSEDGNPYAMVVVPWVGIVLGWTYLTNDQKVSAIGEYIRITLATRIESIIGNSACDVPDSVGDEVDPESSRENRLGAAHWIFSWEVAHRADYARKPRKIAQLVIDIMAFVAPGVLALLTYSISEDSDSGFRIAILIEWICLGLLALAMALQADLKKDQFRV